MYLALVSQQQAGQQPFDLRVCLSKLFVFVREYVVSAERGTTARSCSRVQGHGWPHASAAVVAMQWLGRHCHKAGTTESLATRYQVCAVPGRTAPLGSDQQAVSRAWQARSLCLSASVNVSRQSDYTETAQL